MITPRLSAEQVILGGLSGTYQILHGLVGRVGIHTASSVPPGNSAPVAR